MLKWVVTGSPLSPSVNPPNVIRRRGNIYSKYRRWSLCSDNAPRTVVLQKGKNGFGFVLRGAKCKYMINYISKRLCVHLFICYIEVYVIALGMSWNEGKLI